MSASEVPETVSKCKPSMKSTAQSNGALPVARPTATGRDSRVQLQRSMREECPTGDGALARAVAHAWHDAAAATCARPHGSNHSNEQGVSDNDAHGSRRRMYEVGLHRDRAPLKHNPAVCRWNFPCCSDVESSCSQRKIHVASRLENDACMRIMGLRGIA